MKTDGVVMDTGAFVAYLDDDDAHHRWAVGEFKKLTGAVVTCEAVLTEAAHLLRKQPATQRMLCEMVESGKMEMGMNFTEEAGAIRGLMERYEDQPMSLADACVVRLAEIWNTFTVLTTDGHFRTYRKNRREVIRCVLPAGK